MELSVRINAKDEEAPLTVSLVRPDSGTSTAPAPFSPPLDDPELADLRWYLEIFSTWPTGPDYQRAERIQSRLEEWGRALRTSIMAGGEDAVSLWQQFVDAPTRGKLLTIDATDPRVLRLPWELLADKGGHIFKRRISVRRRLQQPTTTSINAFKLPVRMLVIVSRPDDAGFISSRAVSQPLLDALAELAGQVEFEFLYPPTLTALTERLEALKLPPIHIVHFDGHGVYDSLQGLGYLLFEDDEHKLDRVDADRLGTLLYDCGIPLMVLNACQSAKQDVNNPYASVAARLIRAGVGSVLAMNYSVLVTAARKFVTAFYGGLATGLTVGQAVDKGRTRLLADEKRHTLTRRNADGDLVEETVRLRDWFLPALYQQAADPVVFSPDAPSPPPPSPHLPISSSPHLQSPAALTTPTAPGGLPADPRHGFHGRSREMLHLERALAEHAVIVLHGFGGLGKTSLAAEAGRWFYRTGRFPGGAAFVSFEHGGSLAQLCSWVGQAISGDPNFSLGDGDPVERISRLLAERPALIILDNFESVLGRDPLMPPAELSAVLDAVWRWATPQPTPRSPTPGPRLLITTRDATFNDARFGPSKSCRHIALAGLAPADALELAAAVLADHGLDRTAIPRQELLDLMDRLGGHPLSLYLVLPHLARHSPAELTARFEELLPGFIAGQAKERNESLAVSLEFSLRRLGDDTRQALPALAVFQGGCFEDDMLAITRIDPELWQTARAEMEQAALVTVESLPGITPPFLRFHPTLLPYLSTQLTPARRAELQSRYWQRYYALSSWLYKTDTPHPHLARAIALRELPNLKHAFSLCLAVAKAPPLPLGEGESRSDGGEGNNADPAYTAIHFADNIAHFLNNFGRWRERDALLKEMGRLEIGDAQGLTKAEFLRLDRQGDILLQQGQAAAAERLFRDLLARLEAGPAYDAAYDLGMTQWRLGRCLAAQGQPTQALAWHRRALAAFEPLSEANESAKEMLGKVYTDLGDNLAAVGHLAEAQQAYESGLDVSRTVGDHRAIGVHLGQLGNLALQRGDLAESQKRHTEALNTFRTLGEPQMEAVAWHQLGRVAEEAKAWDEAERCYREAVRIREQIRDLPLLATTFNQLALVAEGAGRLDDAERWYLRAIALDEQLGNPKEYARDYSNLAGLYLSQNRLEDAEKYARRAAAIKETLDLSAEPWTTYNILAQIAEARGRAGEAAAWRRKEQASYAAYAGAAYQLPQWAPAFINAVVAAAAGDETARQAVEEMLPQMAQSNDWRNLPPVVERILAGETEAEELCLGLDRIDAYIIRTILAQLAGEAPAAAQTSEDSRSAPESSDAADDDRLAQLRAQWEPVIQAVVAAGQGNTQAAEQVEPFIAQLAQQEAWRDLAAVLGRILAGERDPAALLPGLDPTDTFIAAEVLQQLGVDLSAPGPAGEEETTLDDLLNLVASAIGPDAPAGLGQQLFAATQAMAREASAPAEVRALGRALNHILSGDREPDLSALPPEVAAKVRGMLGG